MFFPIAVLISPLADTYSLAESRNLRKLPYRCRPLADLESSILRPPPPNIDDSEGDSGKALHPLSVRLHVLSVSVDDTEIYPIFRRFSQFGHGCRRNLIVQERPSVS